MRVVRPTTLLLLHCLYRIHDVCGYYTDYSDYYSSYCPYSYPQCCTSTSASTTSASMTLENMLSLVCLLLLVKRSRYYKDKGLTGVLEALWCPYTPLQAQ